jgi:hypothetical protein
MRWASKEIQSASVAAAGSTFHSVSLVVRELSSRAQLESPVRIFRFARIRAINFT